MSDLAANKIFGAVLATGLVILGIRTVSDVVFSVEPPEKAGYAIAVQEEASSTAAAPEVPPDWGTVLPAADTAAGQVVSTKCASCHSFAAGGPDMTGPDLYGVIGRKPGTHPGFAYSSAMVDEGNKIGAWDYQHLYEFLAGPQKYLNGTKMTFVGLKKPEERINLIAWLRTQSASPAPIPAPNPAAAAAAAPVGQAGAAQPAVGPNPAAPVANPAAPGAAPANAPVAAAAGAPANATGDNPTGVTPATGAAAAPSALKQVPGGPTNK
jgi:cytochrome c